MRLMRINHIKVKTVFFDLLTMAVLLSLASLTGYLFRHIGFAETNIVIIYLLAVLLAARFSNGYIFGILASVISIFAYNFFFTEPYYTFAVYDPSYLVTFVVMLITALLTSTVTSHAKKSAVEAHEKEAETKALYMLTNYLTDADDIHDIACIAARIISNVMYCKAACLCFDENEYPEKTYIQQISADKQIRRDILDTDEIKQKTEEMKTGYYIGSEFYDWLIYGRDNKLGLIRIPAERAVSLTAAQIRLLHAMIESIALAMDRLISAGQRVKYQEETVHERYRGNLLRAISHDLRTPLSGIMGTAEILLDMTNRNDPRYNLTEEIYIDAEWLHSMVENILSLTRLQEGKLVLNKQLEAVEEVVGIAIHHILQRSPKQEIITDIPNELLLIPMDAKLIGQVLVNLLDNAIKHNPDGKEIRISVHKDIKTHNAVFTVADKGEGIAEADLPKIFEVFYTSAAKHADARQGNGLGLAICDAIVKAHGGNIEAHNNPDGEGAEFVFTLPMKENTAVFLSD